MKTKILIVEDEPAMVAGLRDNFEYEGYEVISAEDGVSGLERALSDVRVRRFDELFFDGEAKEAVAFALLGYLHMAGRPGNVPGATGARGPRILGQLTPA